MEPEFGRDFTVAVVLIAAIVALATSSIAVGALIIGAAVAVFAFTALVRSRAGSARSPHSH
jgi:hypothetical protein